MDYLSSLFTLTILSTLWLSGCGGNVVASGSSNAGSGGGGTGGAGGGTGGTTSSIGPACDGAETELPVVSSFFRPNASTGSIEIDLSTAAATCADPYYFPADCTMSMRLRMELPTDAQTPGLYALSASSKVFAYLDGQAPSGGTSCQNTGHDFNGTLAIFSVDAAHITGAICDNAGFHGTFDAASCVACLGTGDTCASDGECCNLFCNPSSHKCDP